MPPTRSRGRPNRAPQEAPPKNDIWVGLLVISFLALVAGAVMLYLDYSELGERKPSEPPKVVQTGGGLPAGGQPPAGNPPVVPPGPMPMPMPNP